MSQLQILGLVGFVKKNTICVVYFRKALGITLKEYIKNYPRCQIQKCPKFNVSQLFALSNAMLRGSHLYLCLCGAVEN